MKYTKFEKKVIEKLLDYKYPNFWILKKQFLNSSVKDRQITDSWFFTDIKVNTEVESLKYKEKIVFWNLDCIYKWEIVMWFLLYIEDWYLTLLEAYTYDESFLDIDINSCKLTYNKNIDIPKKLLEN